MNNSYRLLFVFTALVIGNLRLTEVSAAADKKCITDADAKRILPDMEKVIDAADSTSKSNKSKSEKLETSCNKWKFARGTRYQIILFRSPNDISGDVRATNVSLQSSKEHNKSCLDKGIATARSLNQSYINRILDLAEKQDSWIMNDLDVGPVHWLRCGAERSVGEFNESVETMIHEMTHGLRKDTCIYFAYSDENLCFDLPTELPARSVAKFEVFPTKDDDGIQGYKYIQNIYMEAVNEGPLVLFDELNAYIGTTKSITQFLAQGGKKAIIKDDGSRPGMLLPLFMAYTVRYLEKVRAKNQSQFDKFFGGQSNPPGGGVYFLRMIPSPAITCPDFASR